MKKTFGMIAMSFACVSVLGACSAEVDPESPDEPILTDGELVNEELASDAPADDEGELGEVSQAYGGCGPDVERVCGAGGKIYAMTSGGCFRLVQQCAYACRGYEGNLCFYYVNELECAYGNWAYCVY